MHPGRDALLPVEYFQYAPWPRLAGPAPRRSRCYAGLSRRHAGLQQGLLGTGRKSQRIEIVRIGHAAHGRFRNEFTVLDNQ